MELAPLARPTSRWENKKAFELPPGTQNAPFRFARNKFGRAEKARMFVLDPCLSHFVEHVGDGILQRARTLSV